MAGYLGIGWFVSFWGRAWVWRGRHGIGVCVVVLLRGAVGIYTGWETVGIFCMLDLDSDREFKMEDIYI